MFKYYLFCLLIGFNFVTFISPDISGSGYSLVSSPQAEDRWGSYGNHPGGYGNNVTIHSTVVIEVKNGKVTIVEAKCGRDEILYL